MAGAIVLAMDAIVWDTPFVAPRDRLFGAAEVTKM